MARPVGKPGETRERIIATALELFVVNGVHATSLQQIADRLGVTKATVYHQFATKDALVVAVVQPVINALGQLLDRAESVPDPDERCDVLLRGMVDLVVGQRRLSAFVHGNRAVEEAFRGLPDVQVRARRITQLLLGPQPGPGRRAAVSILESGLMLSGTDPTVADLSDEDLRRELLVLGRRLLSI